jgi:hypothetical protein
MHMSIKIVSDGTKQGTHVVDAQTGKPLENVSSFMVLMDSSGVSASVFFDAVPFEITAEEQDYEYAAEVSRQLLTLHAPPAKIEVQPTEAH